jgi:Arc/MetJ family transcription regulator
MSRMELEIDEDLLAEARGYLGAGSAEETVRAALLEAVQRARRRELAATIAAGELVFLDDAAKD